MQSEKEYPKARSLYFKNERVTALNGQCERAGNCLLVLCRSVAILESLFVFVCGVCHGFLEVELGIQVKNIKSASPKW